MALRWIDLDLECNEASDCLRLVDEDVLGAHGWDLAYWILLDEDHLDDPIGVIGHRAGHDLHEGWEHAAVPTDCGREAGRTDDTEAAATHDVWVYAFGSHFGAKQGPLQRRRHWLARWHEDALPGEVGSAALPVHVLRGRLRLHRVINDALREHADALVPGSASTWTGIRAMTTHGDDVVDVIVGNLDAVDKDALLLACHPEGRAASSEHWRLSLRDRRGSGVVRAELVNAFDDETRIEGIAHAPEGHVVYVVDEDHRVHVKFLAVGGA